MLDDIAIDYAVKCGTTWTADTTCTTPCTTFTRLNNVFNEITKTYS